MLYLYLVTSNADEKEDSLAYSAAVVKVVEVIWAWQFKSP